MEQYPVRKRNRLPHYDYSANGAYFITICTAGKRNLFWAVGAASRRPPECLSEYGQIAAREIGKFGSVYDGVVRVDNFVVMPNHVHLLLRIHGESADGRRNAAPTVSSVINQYKGCASKAAGFPLWQKSFHDHVIRNGRDYQRIWEYIDSNPYRWVEDRFFIDIERIQ